MKIHYTFSGHFFLIQLIKFFFLSYSSRPFQTNGCANSCVCQTFSGLYYLLLAWLDWTERRCLGFNTYKSFLQSTESNIVLSNMVYSWMFKKDLNRGRAWFIHGYLKKTCTGEGVKHWRKNVEVHLLKYLMLPKKIFSCTHTSTELKKRLL